MAAAAATAAASASATDATNNKKQDKERVADYNPRWKGYIYIAFASLVCFASVSNVKDNPGNWGISLAIGIVTFTLSLLILVLDRFQLCFESFKFHKSYDGKLEGCTLIFFVCWWIAGVFIMTKAGGVAYSATNIYFSSWLALLASCYTLNEWSGSKDIVTVQELTALSTTLRGWYCLFFSSIVVMGSASDLHLQLHSSGPQEQASFAVALGVISFLVAGMFILAHYRFFSFLPVGTWTELLVTFFMLVFWTAGVGVLTQDESVASSINGQCAMAGADNMEVFAGTNGTEEVAGTDDIEQFIQKFAIPGSNLYVFSWLCLVSVIDVALQWKAAQAMSFAQSAQGTSSGGQKKDKDKEGPDDEDDDDGEEI